MKGLIIILLIAINYHSAEASEQQENSKSVPNQNQTQDIKRPCSVGGLQFLARHESQLYQHMKQYKVELQSKVRRVSSWIDDFKTSFVQDSGPPNVSDSDQTDIVKEISSHPLRAFRMIRRFVDAQNLLTDAAQQLVVDHLAELESSNYFPSRLDVENVMGSIIHLRYVYELSVDDLMNGRLATAQTKVGLTQHQVYEIGMYAQEDGGFTEALRWLQALLSQSNYTSGGSSSSSETTATLITHEQLQSDVELISKRQDELSKSITAVDDSFWDQPRRFTTTRQLAFKFLDKALQQDQIRFYKSCAGEVFQSEVVRSQLVCFYETQSHPAWTINPLKIEVHSWSPYLIRIYDIITEAEIQHLRDESSSTMKTATVSNHAYNESDPSSVEYIVDDYRVASSTFLEPRTKILQNLDVKIGQMTGLHVGYYGLLGVEDQNLSYSSYSEKLQIASYGFGGYYELHTDSLPDVHLVPSEGNRLATFMIYLNDVKLGGHTAFPRIGVALQPIKKSAVFWYNLLQNGNEDERLLQLHGGCPVILGTKWISNTWILTFANSQKRQCTLDPDE